MDIDPSFETAAIVENFIDSASLKPHPQQESVHTHAADTLEESEAFYRYIFEANPHPMLIYDCETLRFLLVNDAAVALYGYSREELLARTLLDLHPAADVPWLSATQGNSARSEMPDRGKRALWRHTKKNGQVISVETTGSDIRFRGRAARMGQVNDITERRRSEQALQHIMEGAHCLLYQAEVEDTGAELLQWKMYFAGEPSAQRFLPLHLSEGQSYAEAFYLARPSEDRERSDRYGGQEIRAGRSFQQEFRCHSKDGSLHWLSEDVRVETLGEGKWRCTGVCTDITERKLAEEASRAMTRGVQCFLWHAFVEEQPHGLQWYIETADEEAAQQFFPLIRLPEQSYTEAWARSRNSEDSPVMDARATEALLSGKAGYTNQFRCRRADGEWRWLSETVTIEALAPERWRCVGVCTDVTEQKQAEARIKEAETALRVANEQLSHSNAQTEERFRLLVEGVQDYAIFILDTTGHVMTWNGGAARMKGYRAEEIIGKHFACFFTDEAVRAGKPENALQRATVAGHYEDEGWRVRKDGSRLMASVALTALRDESGQLKGFAKIARDVTEPRKAEADLREAKVQADSANHAKSEFLSRMSHELRTPLNAILGFGQILDRQSLTPLQKESVQYILTGGRHLLSLINEILDLARVEAGHIELSLEAIAIAEIASNSCALVRPLAAERNLSLDADTASFEGSYVLADRQRLNQALINLLSNAIKYNRQGGLVRVYSILLPENRLAIAVQDTGSGISVEDQQKLFLPFERLSAGFSPVEGTGLGLAMAQRLVVAMGGSLTLESLPGEGTTFFIELPRAPSL